MRTSDRLRILRGFGIAAGALLVVSGAVFASQAAPDGDRPGPGAEASASEDATRSPEASPSLGGVLADDEATESPEAGGDDGDGSPEAGGDDRDGSPDASASLDAPGDQDDGDEDQGDQDDGDDGDDGDEDQGDQDDDSSGPGGGADEQGDDAGPGGEDGHDD